LKAEVLEIFSSIQGEGPFIGVKQIFIRFAACNMNCRFCDLERILPPKIFSVDKITSIVKQLAYNCGEHHSVSLTGGEPLLSKEFIKELIPKLKQMEFKIYLDRNATLPESLAEVIDLVDIVAADFKLPSSTGEREYWAEHKEFITIAKAKNCFIKVVVTNETKESDFLRAVDIVSDVDRNMLMIIQPVSPVRDIERTRTKLLFDLLFIAEKKLSNVRIMPQMHKVLGVR